MRRRSDHVAFAVLFHWHTQGYPRVIRAPKSSEHDEIAPNFHHLIRPVSLTHHLRKGCTAHR